MSSSISPDNISVCSLLEQDFVNDSSLVASDELGRGRRHLDFELTYDVNLDCFNLSTLTVSVSVCTLVFISRPVIALYMLHLH